MLLLVCILVLKWLRLRFVSMCFELLGGSSMVIGLVRKLICLIC